ncbi:MAG: hypothetical protein ACTS73_05975 [Arsenophonus sp. NEOnobi-MAG3]
MPKIKDITAATEYTSTGCCLPPYMKHAKNLEEVATPCLVPARVEDPLPAVIFTRTPAKPFAFQ